MPAKAWLMPRARLVCRCTVVAIETAPQAKLERMRASEQELFLVPYDVAWQTLDDRAFPGVDGTFVHPFDDDDFIAGHGTMGLEILDDAPETATVLAANRRWGLITGMGSAMKTLRPGNQSHRRRTGNGRAGGAFVSQRLATKISGIGLRPLSMARADKAFSRGCGNG